MTFLHKSTITVSCVKPNSSQWEATLRDDVGFPQYIAEYTVANFWCFPIRRRITYASALEWSFTVHREVFWRHDENTPIQIYWIFYHPNKKKSDKKSDIFHISAQNIDCGYSLEPPWEAVLTSTHNLCFLSRNKKNNVYPCKPQLYYIKVGFRGSKLYRRFFVVVKCPRRFT